MDHHSAVKHSGVEMGESSEVKQSWMWILPLSRSYLWDWEQDTQSLQVSAP